MSTRAISPDFISSNQGTLIVLTPTKPSAEHWLQDNRSKWMPDP